MTYPTLTPAAPAPTERKPPPLKRWVHRAYLAWAVFSTLWMANSFRTQGVAADTLRSSATVSVTDRAHTLEFSPTRANSNTALLFLCGSGVAAQAYAPLLRPLAEEGRPVFIVKLPYRFAPMELHKQEAVSRAKEVAARHPEISEWVVAGHSLGGALACRVAPSNTAPVSALVLIGTTHPKKDDLSGLPFPVTKVYASEDGVAPPEKIRANRALLPAHTEWVEIAGGNHSQFGHYGHQFLDGDATISRAAQQEITRAALRKALAQADGPRQPSVLLSPTTAPSTAP